jgi:hypothetical protein
MADTDASTITSKAATLQVDSQPIDKLALPWYKKLDQSKGILLFVICMAQMLDIINVASVTIALPSILRDVHYEPNQLQW